MSKTPLSGLRVIELASVLAGPRVGQCFAEWGAEVIKIENPATGGDITRSWKLPGEPAEASRSAYFSSCNWGKSTRLLDFRKPEDIREAHQLIETADIVLSSYKAGDAEKLRMDYATLRPLNPRLIYGQITGYPHPDTRVGYDAILQAEAGFTYMNGEPEGTPHKMPVALIDVLAAHQLREALLLALLQRTQTDTGTQVTVSLFESAVSALANQATNYLMAGHTPQPMGSAHPNIVPYGTLFPTQTYPLVLAVGSDAQFARLCTLLERPEWATEERFRTNPARVKHRETLLARLRERFLSYEAETLLPALHRAHVPAGALRDMAAVFADPNTIAIRLSSEETECEGVRMSVARFDGALPQAALTPPPAL